MTAGGRTRSVIRAVVVVALVAGCLAASRVTALPRYAGWTGLACAGCHIDPNGGGPRNDFGFLFARQRHELTPDPDTTWSMLPASNRLGEWVTLGANARMLYLYTREAGSARTGLSSFFQMQGAVHTAFQPHPQLGLVVSQDFGEFSGSRVRDLYGIVRDRSARIHLKVGRLRPLFGLRQDEHSAGTLGGFLNTAAGGTGGLAPYDPRDATSGIEAGWSADLAQASVQFGNGAAPFSQPAQAVSAKAMVRGGWGTLGVTGYDRFGSATDQGVPINRATRWSAFGWTRVLPSLVVLGEAGLGTDELPGGARRNLAATWFEADWKARRALTLRGRYDFLDTRRGVAGHAAERFSVETDVTVVPFADLRLAYRRIVPETTADEDQLLALWHFYF